MYCFSGKAHWMGATILVLDADERQRQDLRQFLMRNGWKSEGLETLGELNQRLADDDILAVIIDIDSVPLENRTFRDLAVQNPAIYFFCLSERRFHPELEDAIGSHLYACINKPVDPDELLFWMRSIEKDEEGLNSTRRSL
jgi:DNA-binding NtrC family response regulator